MSEFLDLDAIQAVVSAVPIGEWSGPLNRRVVLDLIADNRLLRLGLNAARGAVVHAYSNAPARGPVSKSLMLEGIEKIDAALTGVSGSPNHKETPDAAL